MEREKLRELLKLTKEEVADIFLDAMDNGEWHTPGIGKLNIDQGNSSNACITGSFESSLHNTYHNEERLFEINKNSVRIWGDIQAINNRGKLITQRLYGTIYCIDRIVEKLNSVPFVNVNANSNPT